MDVDSIPVGEDFVVHLRAQIDRCDAVVVLIGENWTTPRLRDQRDFVRIEIERALDRGKVVIPVLLDGARMPVESEIPYSLTGLLNRQAMHVRRESYRVDLPHLIEMLRSVKATPRAGLVQQWALNVFRPSWRATLEAAFIDRVRSDVLEEIVRRRDQFQAMSTETRMLTVMLCDAVGFSTVAEQLAADETFAYLADLMTPFTDAILRRRGTLDKYLGDSLLAFWNAPLDDRTPEANACAAALDIHEALTRIGQAASERAYPAVRVGIGLATGLCAVGAMGTRRRFEYSCFGGTVDVASRLASLTRTYGVWRLIDEATARAVAKHFAVLEIDVVRVKGQDKPMRVFALLGDEATLATDDFHAFAENFAAAYAAYLAQDWDRAEERLAAARDCPVAGLDTVALCEAPLERIRVLRESPPERDWDGVFRWAGLLTK